MVVLGYQSTEAFFCILSGTDGFVYRMFLGLNKGYSYLAPFYWRHKYEGRVTNHLMFPLYSSITRSAPRQPIGGEFAFNGTMLVRFTNPESWTKSWRDFGIDAAMSVTAATSGDSIGQLHLPRKINYVGDDARRQIGDMFVQEGRSLFNGLIDMLDSTPFWAESEVTMAPVVETEAVHNTNLKVELSENAEIIATLHSFLSLYMSLAFQNNSETISGDGLSDGIKGTFKEFKGNGLCSVLVWNKPKEMPRDQQAKVIDQLQSIKSKFFLNSDEWAQIVFRCFKEFQVKRSDNELQATQTVIRGVLLCVFYLRVLSFNIETSGLPTYPDAEELVMGQMKVSSHTALAYLKDKNNDREKVANGTLAKSVQISLSS